LNRPLLACAAAVALIAAGCGGSSNNGATHNESATGTTAAQCNALGWTNLTYQSFGKSFLDARCVVCHDSRKTGAARNGSPAGFNFDTLAGFQQHRDHIDAMAGMNPSGTPRNTFMPPTGSPGGTPTDEERQQLSCWIAQGGN
jgi:uncharacterized membrane protein